MRGSLEKLNGIGLFTGPAVIVGYFIGSCLPASSFSTEYDARSPLRRLRDSRGEDSAIVKVLEGYTEPRWSSVPMNLYIPLRDKAD